RWKPGPPQFIPLPGRPGSISLVEGNDGAVLIVRREGIRRIVERKTEVYPIPGVSEKPNVHQVLRDGDGGLWIGTLTQGLVHVHQGRTDVFSRSDGLSGESVLALFEDREGSIWLSTNRGLERFRDFAVPTFSAGQGLRNAFSGGVLAAGDGSVWLGT